MRMRDDRWWYSSKQSMLYSAAAIVAAIILASKRMLTPVGGRCRIQIAYRVQFGLKYATGTCMTDYWLLLFLHVQHMGLWFSGQALQQGKREPLAPLAVSDECRVEAMSTMCSLAVLRRSSTTCL
jgi:hypothetical protein